MTQEEFITLFESNEKKHFEYLDLSGLDLSYLDFTRASFHYCNLSKATFLGANLFHAEFYACNLKSTNFFAANLFNVFFQVCDLQNAEFESTNYQTVHFLSCFVLPFAFPSLIPSEGSFIGYKKCRDGAIVKLEIAADAERLAALDGKCRCSKAKVLSITNEDGKSLSSAVSLYDEDFIYELGKEVSVPNFDSDRFSSCGHGIHFFLSKQEAWKYRK